MEPHKGGFVNKRMIVQSVSWGYMVLRGGKNPNRVVLWNSTHKQNAESCNQNRDCPPRLANRLTATNHGE
jgi:hypothetical protein